MKFVIDRNSLINLQRYYYFDRNSTGVNYEVFNNFIKEKIENGQIIIINKVDEEGINGIKKEFNIKNSLIKQELNYLNMLELIADEQLNINPYHTNKNEEIEVIKIQEKTQKADLSLIAYCKMLKDKGENVCLITDERKIDYTKNNNAYAKRYTKYYKRIPNICENYDIKCRDLPYLLFEIFSNELEISLNRKSKNNKLNHFFRK